MRVGNVKEIVFSKDPKQMNWLREDFPYAEVKCPPEFSAEVQNEKDGDVLTTKIVVSYNGAHPYFTNAGSIGVSFPLQDRYTDSVTCGDYRCHAHIFCGENTSYIMALRMGGAAPHMGMVLTKGSLSAYSVERDLIEQKKPELLVTDIRMPRVSGLDLVKYIDEKNYPTKTIILSGYSEFEYAQQALRYGVTEYLVKPILKKDFQISLEHVMEKFFEKEESFPDDGISAVKKYIAEHVGEDLSLEILGEVAHLHPAYLSKTFKEETGKNLSAYITDVKMEKAAELLSGTDRWVHEIMESVGYQKSQYFSKIFKEKYGVTPNEYRRTHRG